jgi:hypothetical protein
MDYAVVSLQSVLIALACGVVAVVIRSLRLLLPSWFARLDRRRDGDA